MVRRTRKGEPPLPATVKQDVAEAGELQREKARLDDRLRLRAAQLRHARHASLRLGIRAS